MENKKILMVATTDNMIWQFLIPHIKHLQQMGNTVECVCAETGFWFKELETKYGFVMHKINFARNPLKPANIKAYKELKKLQEKNNYNLIYCQQPVGGMMGRLLGKKYKIPVIYTAHGFHFFKGCSIVNKLIYKPVEKYLSKYTDALITINDEDYENAKKMKAKRVYKINGIGIDDSKIKVENFDKNEFKESLGINQDDKVVLTVSEINKNKNYITMLQAIKIVAQQYSNIKFVCCGKGVWEQKIKDYTKQLGIDDKVIFLGYRKDVAKIMQISDIFLHASYREGLTLSVMEAMSFGLPCIVSNVRGNRDLIVDGKGGYIVEPKDNEACANKIKQLIENKSICEEFGKFNKQESEKYTIQTVINQLSNIYREFDKC